MTLDQTISRLKELFPIEIGKINDIQSHLTIYTTLKFFTLYASQFTIELIYEDEVLISKLKTENGIDLQYDKIRDIEISEIRTIRPSNNITTIKCFRNIPTAELLNNIEDIIGFHFDETDLYHCKQFIKRHPEVPKTMYQFNERLTFYCPSQDAVKIDDITQMVAVTEIKFVHNSLYHKEYIGYGFKNSWAEFLDKNEERIPGKFSIGRYTEYGMYENANEVLTDNCKDIYDDKLSLCEIRDLIFDRMDKNGFISSNFDQYIDGESVTFGFNMGNYCIKLKLYKNKYNMYVCDIVRDMV